MTSEPSSGRASQNAAILAAACPIGPVPSVRSGARGQGSEEERARFHSRFHRGTLLLLKRLETQRLEKEAGYRFVELGNMSMHGVCDMGFPCAPGWPRPHSKVHIFSPWGGVQRSGLAARQCQRAVERRSDREGGLSALLTSRTIGRSRIEEGRPSRCNPQRRARFILSLTIMIPDVLDRRVLQNHSKVRLANQPSLLACCRSDYESASSFEAIEALPVSRVPNMAGASQAMRPGLAQGAKSSPSYYNSRYDGDCPMPDARIVIRQCCT